MGFSARHYLLATALYAAAGSAQAQTAAQSAGAPLEEVTVSATRRTTNLQETPVAVSALTPDLIATAAPREFGDLAAYVPNFSATRVAGFSSASFAMRGVAVTDGTLYSEAPVGVLVDDFVMTTPQVQVLDTFDIASVEVLRGPQGTLFGKNTTGGAVVIHTKRPDLAATAVELRAELGDFGTQRYRAAVDVPLADRTLGLRIAGAYDKSDGYMRNGACYGPVTPFGPSPYAGATGCGNGDRAAGDDVFSGRAKLLWQPNDTVTALLQYELLRDRAGTPAGVNETPLGDSSFTFNLLGLTRDGGDPLRRAGVTLRDDAFITTREGQRVDVDGAYLNVDVQTAAGTLASISGYRLQKSRLPASFPSESGPVSLFDANRDDDRETWQQELRFASDFGAAFDFVAGAFYQEESVDFCATYVLGFLDLLGVALPFGTWQDNPQVLCNRQRSKSYAGYAEGNWKMSDRLMLTAGARYTVEKKTWAGRHQIFFQQLGGAFDPGLTWQTLDDSLAAGDFSRFPSGVLSDSQRWSEPTWRTSASYEFRDGLFGYFTYSRGFKSGGYVDQTGVSGSPLVPAQILPTDPELADSFELGLKTEAFDHRLRGNLAAFYVRYNDAQRQVVVPVTRPDGTEFQETRSFNAAKVVVQGVEAEITAVPVEPLTLRAIVGFQDGEYDEFESPLPTGRDLDAAPLVRTPRWQTTLDATYELSLGASGKLTFNGNAAYQSRQAYSLDISDARNDTYLEARTLFNASIEYSDVDDRYFLRAIGRNLGDKRYRTANLVVVGLWVEAMYGPPRYLGVEAGYRFGGK